MSEALRIGASVATPLGWMGLIATFVLFAYYRYLRSQENQLQSLPESERAKSIESWFTRLGLTIDNLTREQKYEFVCKEMERRAAFAKLLVITGAVVIVFCVGIATAAYIVRNPGDERIKSASLPENSAQVKSIEQGLQHSRDELISILQQRLASFNEAVDMLDRDLSNLENPNSKLANWTKEGSRKEREALAELKEQIGLASNARIHAIREGNLILAHEISVKITHLCGDYLSKRTAAAFLELEHSRQVQFALSIQMLVDDTEAFAGLERLNRVLSLAPYLKKVTGKDLQLLPEGFTIDGDSGLERLGLLNFSGEWMRSDKGAK